MLFKYILKYFKHSGNINLSFLIPEIINDTKAVDMAFFLSVRLFWHSFPYIFLKVMQVMSYLYKQQIHSDFNMKLRYEKIKINVISQ